ncbi:unnamed protein product, partial [Closterium sp. NIES-53]
AVELPHWHDLLLQNVPIFDLDFDAILAAMYAIADSAEGDCYLSVPPDPGTAAAALGASASAAPGTGVSAAPGGGASALFGTAPTESLHTPPRFYRVLRPRRACCRDSTSPCQRVTHCTCSRTGRHLTTFTRRQGSSLYTLTTAPPPDSASGQVAASSQVFAAASRSSPASAPCSCRPLSHKTLLWHHRLGHPSLPRLRGMASRALPASVDRVTSVTSCWSLTTTRVTPQSSPCAARVRGGEFSSDLLRAFSRSEGIRQTFTLPTSPQQNGIAERRIGMYAAHQINLQPRVSLPETTPTLRWTGKVGDASAFRVWESRAFVRDTLADKLSSRAVPCVFLGFPPDAPRWQFYHPTSRRVLSSQDVTFDESVSYY